jgi:hypothetical protein
VDGNVPQGVTLRPNHYATFVVDPDGKSLRAALSQQVSSTRCGLARLLSISFVSTPNSKAAPNGAPEFGGALLELACAKIRGRGSTAHSGAQCSREQSLVRELLGADTLPDHSHRDVYDRIWRSGRLLLQLHAWDAEDHPNLVNGDAAPHGHGVVLWFQVDDFDSAVERARRLEAEIIEEPHVNPAPQHREIWLRDPDGYVVVVASSDGESVS